MANITLAYDSFDPLLGEYFSKNATEVLRIIESSPNITSVKTVAGKTLNEVRIAILLEEVLDQNSILITMSHGDPCNLLYGQNQIYLGQSVNQHLTKNCLIFALACSSAKNLGPYLVENHSCITYIGYVNEVVVVITFEDSIIECVSAIFNELFLNQKTIKDALESSFEVFTQKIDELTSLPYDRATVAAMELRHRRDSIKVCGRSDYNLNSVFVYM